MRALVVLALLLVGQEPDIDALIKQLTEGSIEERDQAVKALIECGEKSAPKLRARMAAAEGDHRTLLSQILERIAIPKNLRGVLPPITRVTIDVQDQELKEVLEEFQRQTRLPMKLTRLPRSGRIKIRVQDAAPLQALDSICKAAGLHWDFPSDWHGGPLEFVERREPKVTLLQGPEMQFMTPFQDRPRLFVRHYAVDVPEIVLTRTNDFRKGRSRCELGVGLYWTAGVQPYSASLHVTSVVDSKGNQLLEGPDDPNAPKGPRQEVISPYNQGRIYNRYRFRYPGPGVKSLDSVRGAARMYFLLREKTVTFEAPEKAAGVRKQVENVTTEILGVESHEYQPGKTYPKVRMQIKGREWTFPPRIRAKLENGKFSGMLGAVPSGDPADGIYEVHLYDPTSNIVAIEAAVESVCAEDAFDFEFKDVPLP